MFLTFDRFHLVGEIPSWEGLAREEVLRNQSNGIEERKGGRDLAYWSRLHMTARLLPLHPCFLASFHVHTGSRSIKTEERLKPRIGFVLKEFIFSWWSSHSSHIRMGPL